MSRNLDTQFRQGSNTSSSGRLMKRMLQRVFAQLEARMKVTNQQFGVLKQTLADGTEMWLTVNFNGPVPIRRSFVVAKPLEQEILTFGEGLLIHPTSVSCPGGWGQEWECLSAIASARDIESQKKLKGAPFTLTQSQIPAGERLVSTLANLAGYNGVYNVATTEGSRYHRNWRNSWGIATKAISWTESLVYEKGNVIFTRDSATLASIRCAGYTENGALRVLGTYGTELRVLEGEKIYTITGITAPTATSYIGNASMSEDGTQFLYFNSSSRYTFTIALDEISSSIAATSLDIPTAWEPIENGSIGNWSYTSAQNYNTSYTLVKSGYLNVVPFFYENEIHFYGQKITLNVPSFYAVATYSQTTGLYNYYNGYTIGACCNCATIDDLCAVLPDCYSAEDPNTTLYTLRTGNEWGGLNPSAWNPDLLNGWNERYTSERVIEVTLSPQIFGPRLNRTLATIELCSLTEFNDSQTIATFIQTTAQYPAWIAGNEACAAILGDPPMVTMGVTNTPGDGFVYEYPVNIDEHIEKVRYAAPIPNFDYRRASDLSLYPVLGSCFLGNYGVSPTEFYYSLLGLDLVAYGSTLNLPDQPESYNPDYTFEPQQTQFFAQLNAPTMPSAQFLTAEEAEALLLAEFQEFYTECLRFIAPNGESFSVYGSSYEREYVNSLSYLSEKEPDGDLEFFAVNIGRTGLELPTELYGAMAVVKCNAGDIEGLTPSSGEVPFNFTIAAAGIA